MWRASPSPEYAQHTQCTYCVSIFVFVRLIKMNWSKQICSTCKQHGRAQFVESIHFIDDSQPDTEQNWRFVFLFFYCNFTACHCLDDAIIVTSSIPIGCNRAMWMERLWNDCVSQTDMASAIASNRKRSEKNWKTTRKTIQRRIVFEKASCAALLRQLQSSLHTKRKRL